MTIEELIARYDAPMARHLSRLVGSEHLAEDLRQELFLRMWQRGPRDAAEPQLRAWLYRVARNLAIDALRRQRVRRWEELSDNAVADPESSAIEAVAIEAGLAQLRPADRFVLRLTLAGYALAEIGLVLGVSSEAARKRVARARLRLARALAGDAGAPPAIVVLHRGADAAGLERFFERMGARAQALVPESIREQLLLADGVVVAGDTTDIAPAVYGEARRRELHAPDAGADRADIALLAEVLRSSLPVLAICRGCQLLNVALGGTLYQDLAERSYRREHLTGPHIVATRTGSRLRMAVGRRASVTSDHHQAVHRLGRELVVTGTAADGAVEALEHARRPHTVGVQWQPQRVESGRAGERIAEVFVEVARLRPAA